MKKPERFYNRNLSRKFTTVILLPLMVVVVVFAAVLFRIMEQNVVSENLRYMENSVMRKRDETATKMEPICMTTQFFLSDEELSDMLSRVASGEEIAVAEWLEFKKTKVVDLERLVNNNPLLYGVRVYADGDSVQEMMPVLYGRERMKRQAWAEKDDYLGWNFDYTDNTFEAYRMSQNQKLVSLVTEIRDYDGRRLGVIEAAMTMENMFPSLYEGIEDEWSCFITSDGVRYTGASSGASERYPEPLLAEYRRLAGNGDIATAYLKKQKLIVSYMPIREMDGVLVCVKDIAENLNRVQGTRNIFVVLLVVFLLLFAFGINSIVRHMLRQFYEILHAVRKVQGGDLSVRIQKQSQDEMGELSDQLNEMLDRIQELMQDNIDREVLAKNSEIRALQNQINAHFIYNVLETIKMMAEIDEEYDISDAITSLGKLLRYSMRWASGNVMVSEELEYIKNYVTLINLRFDYEILLSLKLPEAVRRQEIPKMSLQPIVENAILHGIEEVAADTTIYIKGCIKGGECVIEITDSGRGMNRAQVEELKKKIAGRIEASGGSGNGIGLKNVQDRITMAFGSRYGLDIASQEGCYTKVIVRLPERTGRGGASVPGEIGA